MKPLSFVKAFLFAFLIMFNEVVMGTDRALAYDSSLPVYVNEEPSGYKAVAVNGEWRIKLRDICAIYFVEINYDDTTQTITIYDEPTPTKLKLLGDKVAEIDGMETRLGQSDYDYGDNLTWAAHYSPDIEPLPHTGMVVREDGVYTVGYSRAGFFENNVIDKDIFLDTYGYYRLDKNGGKHEEVANWPE